MKKIWLLFILLWLPAAPLNAQETSHFNLEHVRGAITYFEEKKDYLINGLALTEASQYIQRHAIFSDHPYQNFSILNMTKALIETQINISSLNDVKARISLLENSKDKQDLCYLKAQDYLPISYHLKNPLYLTWGYTLTSSLPGYGSINIASTTFDQFPEKVWGYCLKEITKSALMDIFPNPAPLKLITKPLILLAYIENNIFIQGVSSFIGFKTKSLNEIKVLDQYIESFVNSSALSIDQIWEKFLNPNDIQNVGFYMAKTINKTFGKSALMKASKAGPKGFFETYKLAKNN